GCKILEENAREVTHAGHPGSAEGGSVWICLQPRNQFLQVVRGQGFLCAKNAIEDLVQRHWLKIALYVVWKRVDGTVGDMRSPIARAECVAIGSGAKHSGGADIAVCATHVFNNDCLTKEAAHRLDEDTQNRIRSTSRRERKDQGDWPRRIRLCSC